MLPWQALPGETPIDPSGLRIKGIVTRAELNVVEAQNVRKATVKYLARRPSRRTAPFHVSWCLKLHREMFGDVWRWAGRIRTSDLNLGVPFYSVQAELFSLTDDVKHWPTLGMEWVEQAARLHQRAVKIHPFENGNGRWARLLANIWLKQRRQPLIEWPDSVIGEQSGIRQAYIAALRMSDEGDFEPLIGLHRQYLTRPAFGAESALPI